MINNDSMKRAIETSVMMLNTVQCAGSDFGSVTVSTGVWKGKKVITLSHCVYPIAVGVADKGSVKVITLDPAEYEKCSTDPKLRTMFSKALSELYL